MRRITGLPDEQVATYEERIEAVIAAQLQAIMDRIADRIASIQVASAVLVAADGEEIPDALPPGQPYVSPDDLAPITPMWQQAVGEAIMPIAVEVFQAAAGIVYGQIVDATGVPFPAVGSLAAEQYLAGARNTFDDIGNDLWETARGQLLDGFEQGESIPELTQRLRNSAGMTSKTATLVGRTKVIEASNAGSIATARASGLEMEKEWLATPDPRTRPTHLAADGQRVALHEPFIVGGYPADFPADPSLPPAEAYNCRCAVGYVMPERTVRESREQAVIDEDQATLPGTSPAEPIPEGMRAVSGAPGMQRTLTDLEPPESPKRVFQQLPNPTPPTWRPGAWTESNLLRAREDIAEREFRQYVDTQERFDLAVDESYGRQLGRGIAVQEVPDDARAFVNGDILVVVRSPDLVSEDVRRAVMTQLDALQEANPVDRPFTVRLWGQASPTGNKAMTGPDAISMFGELKLAISSKRATSRFLMPSAGETGESIYDLTHEYGHALMFQRGHGALASQLYDELDLKRRGDEGRIIPTKDTLGYYATEDYKEAYAEAFAEWQLSAGLTENPMVLRYAQTFGWRSPLDVDARSRLPGGLDVDLADEFVVAPTVIRPALRAAKTERELQQAWRAEYQRISGRDILIQVPPNPSMATMRQYAEGTLQALERFPEAKIGEISWWSEAGGAYAQVIPGGRFGATLQFNAHWAAADSRARLLRAMRGDQSGWEKPGRDGWSTRGAGSPTATAYHEFAHVLDLENTGGRIGPQALAAVRRAAGREGVDDDTLVSHDISIYAGSDVNEMIAEAFTDVMVRGPQASPISREIYDLVVVEYRRGGYGLRMAPALDELDEFDDEARRVFARRPAPAKVPRIDRSGSAGEILDEERRVKSQALSAPPVKLADLAAASPNGVKTRALYYYQRFGDEHMNGLLVRGKVGAPPGVKRADLPSEEKVRESIARLDSIMDESVLTEEMVTYRGLANLRTVFPGSHEPGSLAGKTFVDKRFVSTSADRGVAEQFMVGEGQRAQGALLEIISPRGTKAIQISNADFMGKSPSVTSEFEILLQRGLRYRVISDEMRPMPFVRFAGGTREPAFERDPIRHLVVEVVQDEPSVPSAPVIAPVANARTPLAALRDMARARGIDTTGVRKADLVRLVNETPELSPAQIQRAAARARHAEIAQGEGTAKLLAEIDELISKGAARAQLRQSLDPALIAPDSLFANADRAVLDALREALDTGDAAKLKAAVTRLSTRSKVKIVGGRAGAKAKFDSDTMEGFGDAEIPAGAQVQIVRRGSSLTMPDGEVIQLEKARVTLIEPKPKPVSAAEKRRLAAVERQATIDRKRGLADVLAEIDELLDSGASTRALRARLTARNALVRLPDDQIDALLAAVDDRDQLVAVIARLAGDAEIERVGLAGRVVAFDPKIHEGIAAGIRLGQSVRILRPGYTWRDADGTTVNLRRAEVIVTDDPLTPQSPRAWPSQRVASIDDLMADFPTYKDLDPLSVKERFDVMDEIKRQVEPAFSGSFAGIGVKVKQVVGNRDFFSVTGTLTDESGKKIGNFSRYFDRDSNGDIVAHHTILKISRVHQGSRFAEEFNQNLYDWYRRSGIKRVELQANIDVGGYAWATKGYDFRSDAAADMFLLRVLPKVKAAIKKPPKGITRDELIALDAYLDDINRGKIPARAFDISQFGRRPGQSGKDALWPGKWLMLKSTWDGVLHL